MRYCGLRGKWCQRGECSAGCFLVVLVDRLDETLAGATWPRAGEANEERS